MIALQVAHLFEEIVGLDPDADMLTEAERRARDERVANATWIHRRAEERWTVASLAREVQLSRSVFAERFSRLVGMPPMQYVTRWRMSLARSWMREERMSASEAAYRLGYSSEAAFSRAFKRHLQVPPGVLRRGT